MYKKILIIAPSWVGDMVMAQSLMMALKQQNADTEIHVLAPSWTKALTSRMPEVSQAIHSPFKHGELGLMNRVRLGRKLKSYSYDEAYVLPNSFKSALVPFFAKVPKRIGWRGEFRFGILNQIRFLNKADYPLMVQRFSALAYPPNSPLGKKIYQPKLQVSVNQVSLTLEQFNLNQETLTKQKIIAICPGAEFGPSKRWPVEHFTQCINLLVDLGWHIWLFGSEKDKTISEYILKNSTVTCVDFIGKTSLDQAIDLLSVVNAVVTNDSGLMHIACALSKPVVAIYGSTSTEFTPPLGETVKVVERPLPCRPCFKRICPLGHHKCMKEIKPEEVILAVKNICAS